MSPVSGTISHFPTFNTRIFIPVGNLSEATCSSPESGLNVEFLLFCQCSSRGVQAWRPLASLQTLLMLVGAAEQQTPRAHSTPSLPAGDNLLGPTNTSLLYFHANEEKFPMEKAGRKLDNACKANVSCCLSTCATTQTRAFSLHYFCYLVLRSLFTRDYFHLPGNKSIFPSTWEFNRTEHKIEE